MAAGLNKLMPLDGEAQSRIISRAMDNGGNRLHSVAIGIEALAEQLHLAHL